jgi:hypothetical protein
MDLAFRLREEKAEQSLSGDHFEYYPEKQYEHIVHALRDRHFSLSATGRLLKLNCGTVSQKVQPYCVEAVYFERDSIGSHTGLFGLAGAQPAVTVVLRSCIIEQMDISKILD